MGLGVGWYIVQMSQWSGVGGCWWAAVVGLERIEVVWVWVVVDQGKIGGGKLGGRPANTVFSTC